MKIFILSLFILSCSHSIPSEIGKITLMQQVWDSKDPAFAKDKVRELRQLEEDDTYFVLGVGKEQRIPFLSITYDKKTNKAASASLFLDRSKNTVNFIKSQISTSDWKTYEHPIKQHPPRAEISEYSKAKGISFLYNKLDPKQEVRVIYWGVDPKEINW
jgi:hypothetical protein